MHSMIREKLANSLHTKKVRQKQRERGQNESWFSKTMCVNVIIRRTCEVSKIHVTQENLSLLFTSITQTKLCENLREIHVFRNDNDWMMRKYVNKIYLMREPYALVSIFRHKITCSKHASYHIMHTWSSLNILLSLCCQCTECRTYIRLRTPMQFIYLVTREDILKLDDKIHVIEQSSMRLHVPVREREKTMQTTKLNLLDILASH